MKQHVIIPAYRVREKIKGGGEIECYVNQTLKLLEGDIEDALENEKLYAVTELDTVFDIPYMKNQDAQRDVYFHIAQALIKASYIPRIMFYDKKNQSQRVFMLTTWVSKEDKEIDKYKDDFLKAISIKPNAAIVPSVPELVKVSYGKKTRLS